MEFSIDDSPSIQALGSLFKLTEVHFLDDGFSESSFVSEPIKYTNRDLDVKKRDSVELTGSRSLPEDLELAEKMNELGLPLSFRTNKERRYGVSSGKRKGIRENNQRSPIESRNSMLDSIEVGEETTKASIFTNSISIPEDRYAIITGIDSLSNLCLERVDSLSSTACTGALANEVSSKCEVSDLEFRHSLVGNSTRENCIDVFQSTNESLCPDDGSCVTSDDANNCDVMEIKEESKSSAMEHDTEEQSKDVSFEFTVQNVVSDMTGNHQMSQQEDWSAYWDDFHMRTYFYNVKTEESTWDPPTGMEHLVFGNFENVADDSANVLNELAELNNEQVDSKKSYEVCSTEGIIYGEGSASQQFGENTGNSVFADNGSSINATKKKKKVKRTKSNKEVSVSVEEMQGVLQEVTPSISKYWWQRYILFSRFDSGIRMDEEGWFSVTPESIAKHHAARCGTGSIIDFFTGVGGNAIQFAQWSKHVIAIDIDPNKIEYARHNAAIYGVEDNIDFIKGDSFSLAPKLKANTVFMSPPWGGPDYSKVKRFDMNMLRPRDGQSLFNVGKEIAPQIVMFLPRNVDINQLAEISLSATPPWSLEVEKNFMNGRLKSVTAYFSEPSKSPQQQTI